jgi:hypothetical protein
VTGASQFHGHGGGGEADKAELQRYFRAVDRGLTGILDAEAPLVLAGVAYYGPIYRSVSAHPDIVEGVVAGSADELSANEAELREQREPGDLDLLNDIALRVVRTGGEVIVVADDEMPGGVAIAAILRFARLG